MYEIIVSGGVMMIPIILASIIAIAIIIEPARDLAEQTAKWVGECRNGHRHYRFKSPKGQLSCLYCGRGFNPRNLISWTKRAA